MCIAGYCNLNGCMSSAEASDSANEKKVEPRSTEAPYHYKEEPLRESE